MPTATVTKALRVLLGFDHASDSGVVLTGTSAVTGMTGNTAFSTPPVPLTTLKTGVDTLSANMAAAADGGKQAIAAKNEQRKVVITMLRQLAIYVEANCNGDLAVLTSSGFKARSNTRTATQPPTTQPGFRKIVQGVSGQLLVGIKPARGAYSYELHYAALTGTTPGTWTTMSLTSVKAPVQVNGLTAGTTYAFQIRGLGNSGFTDWSDSVTRMCI